MALIRPLTGSGSAAIVLEMIGQCIKGTHSDAATGLPFLT